MEPQGRRRSRVQLVGVSCYPHPQTQARCLFPVAHSSQKRHRHVRSHRAASTGKKWQDAAAGAVLKSSSWRGCYSSFDQIHHLDQCGSGSGYWVSLAQQAATGAVLIRVWLSGAGSDFLEQSCWECGYWSTRRPGNCPAWQNFNVAIFSNTINVINVKFCVMVLFIELYLFIPPWMTLTIFTERYVLILIHLLTRALWLTHVPCNRSMQPACV